MTKKLQAVASAGASALACFFAIWRLRSSICGASSAFLALSRKASSPPRWSTVRSALADTRTRKLRPSKSEISVTLRRFGRNRRLVLWLEWLTLWPTRGFLPVRSQRHDMAHPSKSAGAKAAPVRSFILEDGRTYRERGAGRQAEDLNRFLPSFSAVHSRRDHRFDLFDADQTGAPPAGLHTCVSFVPPVGEPLRAGLRG